MGNDQAAFCGEMMTNPQPAPELAPTSKEVMQRVLELLKEFGYEGFSLYAITPKTRTPVPLIEFYQGEIAIVPVKKNGQ